MWPVPSGLCSPLCQCGTGHNGYRLGSHEVCARIAAMKPTIGEVRNGRIARKPSVAAAELDLEIERLKQSSDLSETIRSYRIAWMADLSAEWKALDEGWVVWLPVSDDKTGWENARAEPIV